MLKKCIQIAFEQIKVISYIGIVDLGLLLIL